MVRFSRHGMVRWHFWSGLRYLYGVMDSGDYWAKAEENLEMALLAYQRKKHNVCASRAYYSVFLASIAALIALTDLRAKVADYKPDAVSTKEAKRACDRAERFLLSVGSALEENA